MTQFDELTLDVSQSIEIKASIVKAYNSLIRRLTNEGTTPDNRPMPMVMEQWPGGRWFRDLGDKKGHLWGFVQVIKPPTLIEISGPLFMSYAVMGHVQFRLKPASGGVELALRHRAVGMIQQDHREGVVHGWDQMLQDVKQIAE